jgi:hypothetical protein
MMSNGKRRRMCYVCECKPARELATKIGYTHAAKDPTFCSVRCAADFGLLIAGTGAEDDLQWCDTHGWIRGWAAYEGCPDCKCGE